MKKPLILILFLMLVSPVCFGEEDLRITKLPDGNKLVHVLTDGGYGDWEYQKYLDCIEGQEHLYIRITPENYKKIVGLPEDWKPIASWSAKMCIKCKLINIACCGNDSVKYIISKPIDKLEARIEKLEEVKKEKIYKLEDGRYYILHGTTMTFIDTPNKEEERDENNKDYKCGKSDCIGTFNFPCINSRKLEEEKDEKREFSDPTKPIPPEGWCSFDNHRRGCVHIDWD